MIDTAVADVPNEIWDDKMDHHYLGTVWDDICVELSDNRFTSRSHNAGTYNKGCRGPVCMKANREHYRRTAAGGVLVSPEDDRMYDPVVEYFHTVVKHRIHAAQQSILKELKGTA